MREIPGNDAIRVKKGELRIDKSNTVLAPVLCGLDRVPLKAWLHNEELYFRYGNIAILRYGLKETSNNQVERRGPALPANEADLCPSSTRLHGHRSYRPVIARTPC